MVLYTPHTDGPFAGSTLTGTDGSTNRTYTLSEINSVSTGMNINIDNMELQQSIQYTLSNDVVTFLIPVFNTASIVIDYYTSDANNSVGSGMGYCTYADVYRTSGIDSTVVSATDVNAQILQAEMEICRITKNIYWKTNLDSTATSGGNNTLVVSTANWGVNDYAGQYVWLYSGTGSVQIRQILSNTATTLTVDRNWTTTNPASGTYFKIFYVPSDMDPYKDEDLDGSGQRWMFLSYYPVKKIETLTIDSTTITPTYLYVYEKTGKIQLTNQAEQSYFLASYPQDISITYWYGVDHLPQDIKRLVELRASIQILGQQMGGTYDDPSTVGLPEFNVSIGQAYINIRSTLEVLRQEYDELIAKYIKIWPIFG